jgi:hypothetical protein
MSEPMWMTGDPATFTQTYDDVWEFDCDCGWKAEVPCTKEYSHGVCYVYAEWKCPECKEEHTSETEFEDDGYNG